MGSNPTGAWIFVCCECCVLSGRGLCDELITRPEESCRLWCVVMCDLENLKNEEAMIRVGSQCHRKKGDLKTFVKYLQQFYVHVTVHRDKFLIIQPTRCTNFSNLFLKWNSTYMFRTVPLSVITSFSVYIQEWYMSNRFADDVSCQQNCLT